MNDTLAAPHRPSLARFLTLPAPKPRADATTLLDALVSLGIGFCALLYGVFLSASVPMAVDNGRAMCEVVGRACTPTYSSLGELLTVGSTVVILVGAPAIAILRFRRGRTAWPVILVGAVLLWALTGIGWELAENGFEPIG